MQVDDELCLCFHVSWRKVINYIRVHRVKVPSQLSECQSAGTGCGWCRAAMRRLVKRMETTPPQSDDLQQWLDEEYSSARQYAASRQQYIDEGQGQPPSGPT
jgi:bacterioferritin-associated ferredoxin